MNEWESKHGISIRGRCWRLLVNGFDDMRSAGELQKYHVWDVGSRLLKHGMFIRTQNLDRR